MVAELSPPMSVENIQLNLKQKINTKGFNIRGCSLLPDGRMVFSCYSTSTVHKALIQQLLRQTFEWW
jgi:hypothetical protein